MNLEKIIYIRKRNGNKEEFSREKVYNALLKANRPLKEGKVNSEDLKVISGKIKDSSENYLLSSGDDCISMVDYETILLKEIREHKELEDSYRTYNKQRERSRLINTNVFDAIGKIAQETDRDNANVGNNFSSKLLRIASESNKYYNLAKMDKKISRNHETGRIYQHDADAYNLTIICLHVDLKEVLRNGFNTGYGTLNEPNRISSAASLACIIIQSSQNDLFGGQSFANFDNDMAPYLRKSLLENCREFIEYEMYRTEEEDIEKEIKEYYERIREREYVPFDKLSTFIINKTIDDLKQAMSTVVYNLNTMHSRAGSQVPFSSLNIGLPRDIESALICEHLLKEYEKGLGKGEQPIFPNIIFRTKEGFNINIEDEYYYLYKLACRVSAKRMNPTFMSMDSSFNLPHYKKGNLPATMGCRTYIMDNINGDSVVEGRGNAAATTINLPRLALETKGENPDSDLETLKIRFEEKFFEAIEDSKDSLIARYSQLTKLKVKDLPFSAGEKLLMGSENLELNDSIEPIIKHSSWAIGFIGLAESLQIITGKHHGESKDSEEYGLYLITEMRNIIDNYKKEYKLNFSCYATPAEGLSGYFISKDKDMFGEIKGVTDKGFYTNSFHIPVDYVIPYKKKIEIESYYHSLCNGGHISYIEVDGPPTGDIIEKIISTSFKNTDSSYMGVNFHIRYCKNCGTYLESESSNECSKCGSVDIQGISRVTGYLGLDERFGPGKSNERSLRQSHVSRDGNLNKDSLGAKIYKG